MHHTIQICNIEIRFAYLFVLRLKSDLVTCSGYYYDHILHDQSIWRHLPAWTHNRPK